MVEDSELWDIVLDGPFVPMMKEKDGEKTITVPTPRQKYDEADMKKIEKGFKAKTFLVCGIGPDEYNRVSACESAKEIWDCLKTAHEGTEQVKESKIDILTSRYENFKIKEGETIHDMFTMFYSITNELQSLGEPIRMTKQVRKLLRILPKSWESKVDAITEAKDLKVLTMDALIGNLKTHKMNRNYDLSKKEAKNDNSLMMKYKSYEDSSDDDMAYLISRFQKIVRKNKVYKRGVNGTRNATQGDTCNKCGKAEHFIREFPLLKNESKEHQKPRNDKENRRDLVLGKRDRKAAADLVVKKDLAAWGDSLSDSEDPDEPKDVSMVAVQEEETVFNEIFALMAHTADEEEDNQVTLLDMKNDLDKYSLKKLRTLAKVMIDSVIELTSEKDTMNAELDSLTENKVKLEEKMSRMVSLESNNSEHKNQLNQIIEEAEKLNGMSNGLQAEIKEKLKISEKKLGVSLEKSNKLEQDIVKLKEELEKSLKWTKSSKLLSNATS
ncbi:spindle pole body component 110-like [Solanum lycopersicum]|uniref:spindle pole body component 110-like n=1 Tax=Solanum lycopersicum TaxID=4081 RepID=UPI003748ECA5